jgi:hypothetical protein
LFDLGFLVLAFLIAHREKSFLAVHFLFSPDWAEEVSGNFVICCTEAPRIRLRQGYGVTGYTDFTSRVSAEAKRKLHPPSPATARQGEFTRMIQRYW